MMSHRIVSFACGFPFCLGISVAVAQPPEGPPRVAAPLHAALDADRNGEISASEIENAAEALRGLDQNGDGKLTREELRPAWVPEAMGPGRRRALEAPPENGDRPGPAGREGARRDPAQRIERLMRLDADGDQKLSADEIPEQLQAMFDRADADGNSFVTKDELQKLAARRGRREAEDRGGPRERGAGPQDRPGGPEGRRGPGPGRGGPGGGPEGFRGLEGGPEGFRGPGGERFGGLGGGLDRFIDRLFELDADKDGKLSREELQNLPETFGGFGAGRQAPGRPPRPPRPPRPEQR